VPPAFCSKEENYGSGLRGIKRENSRKTAKEIKNQVQILF
jgi:hypothetical protein